MLIRKDDTIVQAAIRPSARNADIGDPFAIKFVGSDFAAVFPYHRLIRARMREDTLVFTFDDGISIECEGSNLQAMLDSTWTARLQIVEQTKDFRNGGRLRDGEIVVDHLRYCDRADDAD